MFTWRDLLGKSCTLVGRCNRKVQRCQTRMRILASTCMCLAQASVGHCCYWSWKMRRARPLQQKSVRPPTGFAIFRSHKITRKDHTQWVGTQFSSRDLSCELAQIAIFLLQFHSLLTDLPYRHSSSLHPRILSEHPSIDQTKKP